MARNEHDVVGVILILKCYLFICLLYINLQENFVIYLTFCAIENELLCFQTVWKYEALNRVQRAG